jgi:hypothetical protein
MKSKYKPGNKPQNEEEEDEPWEGDDHGNIYPYPAYPVVYY